MIADQHIIKKTSTQKQHSRYFFKAYWFGYDGLHFMYTFFGKALRVVAILTNIPLSILQVFITWSHMEIISVY